MKTFYYGIFILQTKLYIEECEAIFTTYTKWRQLCNNNNKTDSVCLLLPPNLCQFSVTKM